MANYLMSKGATDVEANLFMPHEDLIETSFEEDRMREINKKSA